MSKTKDDIAMTSEFKVWIFLLLNGKDALTDYWVPIIFPFEGNSNLELFIFGS